MTFNEINEKGKVVKGEVGKRMVGYLSAALGLVAGLAWNDAVKSAIDYFIPSANNIIAKFIYAACITVLIVVVLLGLEKWFVNKEEK